MQDPFPPALPTNRDPVARDDRAATDENRSVLVRVLRNDTDPDGGRPSVRSFAKPSNGRVERAADGALRYYPNRNFDGRDAFSYTISDGEGGTDTARVRITVRPKSDPEPNPNPGPDKPRCTIRGTNGPNSLVGTPGRDVICGRGGPDSLYGLGGNDLIIGGSSNDSLEGGDGDDTLDSRDGSSKDALDGGSGRDRFRVDRGDTITR